MYKKTNLKKVTIACYLLVLTVLLFLMIPGPAQAASESRITAAKGNGFMSLAKRWNDKYVRQDSGEKYQNQKEVLGYYTKDWPTDTMSQNSLRKNAGKITGVATFSYRLNYAGELVGEAPGEAFEVAWSNGIETLALVHNLSSTGFDRQLVHKVLSDPKLRSKTVSNILNILVRNGFDGVNIDLENIPPGDRQLFNEFMTELKEKLAPQGLKVTVSGPAKTGDNLGDGWSGAFDYKYLAKVADRIMLMTYDEHWIGGAPGPVASKPWVERVVAYSVSVIPKDKLLLGIGNYGYEWVSGSGRNRTVPAKDAISLAEKYGAVIKWDNNFQTPYFYYWKDGKKHTVWFESEKSAALKLDLVNKYGLRGIAIWRLGFESREFWDTVQAKLNK